MTGHIQRRGPSTFRLKYEVDRDLVTGKRQIRYVTFKGTKKQAEAELTRLLAARDTGTSVEPDKVTIGEYMRSWIATADVSPKPASAIASLSKTRSSRISAPSLCRN